MTAGKLIHSLPLHNFDRVARPQSEDEVDLNTASDMSISSLDEFILAGARK